MTPLEYFRLFAAEFASTPDATVNAWLGIAATRIETGSLDTEGAAQALAYYAAHLLKVSTLSAGGTSLATVTSEREGDLARTYATTKGADTLDGSTAYGLQFLAITAGAHIMTRFG